MENQLMTDVLLFATMIGVIVSVAVEMIKKTAEGVKHPIQPALIPLIAFIIGVIIGAIAYPFTPMDLVLRLWAGGIAGWMASGLYESVSKTMKVGGK